MGLLIIADLFLRARNFTFFYTEEGVVPQSLAMEWAPEYAFSFYYLTSDPNIIAGLFVVQGLIAVQLIVGYETRVATLVSFLFVLSLDHHNPLVTSYADTLFRLLLFWAIFLPLGERWSIDAVHTDAQPRTYVANLATLAILMQMIVMYFVNGFHKTQSDVWRTGEATPLIMSADDITFLFAEYAHIFPTLLELGGMMWYYMLLLSFLLFFFQGRLRILGVAMFFGVHAAFAVTVRIGAFPYVAMAGLLLFLQAQFWEDGKTVLEYVNVYDPLANVLSELERRGTAIARSFPAFNFSTNPRSFEKTNVYVVVLCVAIVFSFILPLISFSATAGGIDDDLDPDERIHNPAESLGIAQPEWTIFAPSPQTTSWYYVFPAETADGEVVDVYNDRELTYERPHDELQKQYDTYRERFYMHRVIRVEMADDDKSGASVVLADYLCTEWEEERGTELERINMYAVVEPVTLGADDPPPEHERDIVLFYAFGCDGNEPREIAPPETEE
nr:HTTM domain-containing protein [Natronococcus pandeyae]